MGILVVEDDIVFCKLLTKFLIQNNYVTHDAQDLQTAQELVKHFEFNCIVLDYRLPGANGLDFVKWLIERGESAKIILMSRLLDEELISEGKELGIIDFIKKPLNPKDLLSILKQNSEN